MDAEAEDVVVDVKVEAAAQPEEVAAGVEAAPVEEAGDVDALSRRNKKKGNNAASGGASCVAEILA
jgi:hypothetical protein